MFNFRKKNFRKLDLPLLAVVFLLCLYGLVVLYSASLSLETNIIRSQIISTVLGFIMIGFLLFVDMDFLRELYVPIYAISLGLMLAVTLFGRGYEEWGANNWLVLGPIQFQPSEFVKIGLILSLAGYLDQHGKTINHPFNLLKVLVMAGFPIALILREDLGTAAATSFMVGVMLFSAGIAYRYVFGVIGIGLAVTPVLYASLSAFQKNRILDFLDPMRDPTGTGFQSLQGRIAIGSGQLVGRGLFEGVQTQNNFIPEKQTDYIFAVLSEELGFLGSALLILLYGLMLYRLIVIARESKDLYCSLVVCGVAGMLLIHIFENIGMSVGIMPVTGIPLPFLSHGGTFQLINLIAIGLALSVSIERKPLDFS
ncbi:MAG: rod shape-determining protein RodA [Tissierellia bacterium]|nr:rod shape-determining protein RodA [Tissierellia bacterium]